MRTEQCHKWISEFALLREWECAESHSRWIHRHVDNRQEQWSGFHLALYSENFGESILLVSSLGMILSLHHKEPEVYPYLFELHVLHRKWTRTGENRARKWHVRTPPWSIGRMRWWVWSVGQPFDNNDGELPPQQRHHCNILALPMAVFGQQHKIIQMTQRYPTKNKNVYKITKLFSPTLPTQSQQQKGTTDTTTRRKPVMFLICQIALWTIP